MVDKVRQRDAIVHLNAFFADTPAKDVDLAMTRAYATARRRGEIGGGARRQNRCGKDSTIGRELRVLQAAARHAVKLRVLDFDDCPRVEFPRELRRSRVTYLTKAEILAGLAEARADIQRWQLKEVAAAELLARAPAGERQAAVTELRQAQLARLVAEQLIGFILIAYYTAARRRSVQNLRRDQIDLAGARIYLEDAALPPTSKRRPIVPLYPEIRPVIAELLKQSSTDYLFGRTRDFYRPFVRLFDKLGIRAHPHMLRHSRATHMLLDGEDLYKVARLLGDSVPTVERVYGHHNVDYLATKSTLGSDEIPT